MILYVEFPKDSPPPIAKTWMNEFRKVAGHIVNTQKSAAFSYAETVFVTERYIYCFIHFAGFPGLHCKE